MLSRTTFSANGISVGPPESSSWDRDRDAHCLHGRESQEAEVKTKKNDTGKGKSAVEMGDKLVTTANNWGSVYWGPSLEGCTSQFHLQRRWNLPTLSPDVSSIVEVAFGALTTPGEYEMVHEKHLLYCPAVRVGSGAVTARPIVFGLQYVLICGVPPIAVPGFLLT